MLELEFAARDLAHTRFAVSPLWEVVAGVRVLRRPDEHPLHRPWLAAVRPRLAAARLDWRLLADLVPEGPLTIPVFVAPPPTSSVPDLGVELAALRATPPEQVRAELDGPRAPRTERVEALRQDPEAELAQLATPWRRTGSSRWRPTGRACAPCWRRMFSTGPGCSPRAASSSSPPTWTLG
ncbi:hypothetical protein [Streptomyces sp. ISL-11]|uniref:hypothetical protein n=1 Tax=Streptomyces sp. ISL-11 TaxID=2819174 RepID=UPI0027E4BF33|nr:hypothetical protein [Streptomyces sp. ISL-11]